MARVPWCGAEVYEAAEAFADRCLVRDDSLFTPGRPVAMLENAEALQATVGIEDLSEGTFAGKLVRHLDGVQLDAIQLCAELLFVQLLGEYDTGSAKKAENVETVLALLPSPPEVAPELRAALGAGGAASYGVAKTRRDAYMRFLLRLFVTVKQREENERADLLRDPWAFRELVSGERTNADAMQANALLHLLFPDEFSAVVSARHRTTLLKVFAGAPGVDPTENDDRQIKRIHALVDEQLGRSLDFYEPPLSRVWRDESDPGWEEFVDWACQMYALEKFDEKEYDYKLRIAERMASAREAFERDAGEWQQLLRSAVRYSEQNLVDFRVHGSFLDWVAAQPEPAAAALRAIWADEGPRIRVRGFLDAIHDQPVGGPSARLSMGALLMLGRRPENVAPYKWTVFDNVRKALGRPSRPGELDPNGTYRPEELAVRLSVDGRIVRDFLRDAFPRGEDEAGEDWRLAAEQAEQVLAGLGGEGTDPALAAFSEWVDILEELELRMLARGTKLRNLIDAQSVAYAVVQYDAPEGWAPEDRAAFERFKTRMTGASQRPSDQPQHEHRAAPTSGASLPSPTAVLAEQLLLPLPWLQETFGLLAEKRQLIFYGPPGTGKTYIAQAIGEHIAADGGTWRLVQFHPSYTYEDFFEGYRPESTDGRLSYELVPGPLRRIAVDARAQPDKMHLLVIDELNRGNVSKVFGELYFLLEYRNRAVELQYSRDERFSLPENLLIIGTMNTADRSIALVDSALRRRFYFQGLIPTRPPVNALLRKWLDRHGLEPDPADLLDELNRAIGDEDFSIGPSYFITDGREPDLEHVWAHALMPLLREHFYGRPSLDVEREFGLEAIRARVARAADAEDAADSADGPA
jgi:hypothetical protein